MADLKARFLLTLGGNLSRQAAKQGRDLEAMGKRGRRSMQLLQKSVARTGQMMEQAGNRYTTLVAGLATGAAAKGVVDLELKMTRLGIQAGRTEEEMDTLKKKIFEVAQEKEIRVETTQIHGAIAEIIEMTGDLAFAENNIRNIGLAIQATGAEGKAIGGIMAELQKMKISDPVNVMKALDVLNVQGKEGAFTLQNMAALGPRVINAYQATGRAGTDSLKEMGAALQVIRMGVGSSEQAATAFESMLSSLQDNTKVKKLLKMGVQLYDPEVLAETGEKQLRPVNELMQDIVASANGSANLLFPIFGQEGIRAFNKLMADFKKTGQTDIIDKFMQMTADGTTTVNDSARAAASSAAALTYLKTAIERFADENLTEGIAKLADVINSLDPETVSRIFKGITLGVGSLIAYSAGAKIFRGVRSVLGSGAKPGQDGGLLGGRGDTPLNPLFVTMVGAPAGGKSAPAAAGKGGKPVAGKASRLGNVARSAGRFVLPAALTYSAYQAYSIATNDKASTGDKIEASGGLAGGLAGGLGGAKLGAAIGTLLLPGIGSAIGAGIGGLGGYLAGEFAGSGIGQWIAGDDSAKEDNLAVELTVKDDRVQISKVESSKGVSRTAVKHDTGSMLEAL